MSASLLPPNATALELAMEGVAAERLSPLGLTLEDLWNPDRCPEHLLPVLAWSCRVTVWKDSWKVERKRAVIKKWLKIRAHQGTKWAVREAISVVGYSAEVREWFDYYDEERRARKRNFDVYLWSDAQEAGDPLPAEIERQEVLRVVEEVKPITSTCTVHFGVRNEVKLAPVALARLSTVLRFEVEL